MKILAAVLLIPGLLFLFVVVFYVAFIGRASTGKAAVREAGARELGRTCFSCGQALLPDQNECPTCIPQLIHPVGPLIPPDPNSDGEAEVEVATEFELDSAEFAPPAPPIDSSAAYEGEIVDEPEPPRPGQES